MRGQRRRQAAVVQTMEGVPERYTSLLKRGEWFGFLCPAVISRYVSKGVSGSRKSLEVGWLVRVLQLKGVTFIGDLSYSMLVDDLERLALKVEEHFLLPIDSIVRHIYVDLEFTLEQATEFLGVSMDVFILFLERGCISRRENDTGNTSIIEVTPSAEEEVLQPPSAQELEDANKLERVLVEDSSVTVEELDILRPLDPNEQKRLQHGIHWYLIQLNLVGAYFLEISKYRLLTVEEERQLARQFAAGHDEARDKFILANLRLVVSIAKRFFGRGIELADLVQDGNIGLMRAVEMFDPGLGYKFSTYATWWIKQACGRAVINFSRPVRLPVHRYEELRAIQRAQYQFNQLHGREPDPHELADMTGMSSSTIQMILWASGTTISLDQPVVEDGEDSQTLMDVLLVQRQVDPLVLRTAHRLQSEIKEHIQRVRQALRHFSFQDQLILSMRLGLFGVPEMTLEAVGTKYHITRERIRQIEKELLRELGGVPEVAKQYISRLFHKQEILDEAFTSLEAS